MEDLQVTPIDRPFVKMVERHTSAKEFLVMIRNLATFKLNIMASFIAEDYTSLEVVEVPLTQVRIELTSIIDFSRLEVNTNTFLF